jgi:hypothetical protein
MIEGSLGLIVEGLVSALLVATIFYCISVNRKLERLRSEQKGMHSFIRELSVATGNADKAIQGLRATVQDSGAELAGQIDKGRNMSRLLKGEIENAEQTMSKLIVLAGRAESYTNSEHVHLSEDENTPTSTSFGDLRRSMLGFEGLEEENIPGHSSANDGFVAVVKGRGR